MGHKAGFSIVFKETQKQTTNWLRKYIKKRISLTLKRPVPFAATRAIAAELQRLQN